MRNFWRKKDEASGKDESVAVRSGRQCTPQAKKSHDQLARYRQELLDFVKTLDRM